MGDYLQSFHLTETLFLHLSWPKRHRLAARLAPLRCCDSAVVEVEVLQMDRPRIHDNDRQAPVLIVFRPYLGHLDHLVAGTRLLLVLADLMRAKRDQQRQDHRVSDLRFRLRAREMAKVGCLVEGRDVAEVVGNSKAADLMLRVGWSPQRLVEDVAAAAGLLQTEERGNLNYPRLPETRRSAGIAEHLTGTEIRCDHQRQEPVVFVQDLGRLGVVRVGHDFPSILGKARVAIPAIPTVSLRKGEERQMR